MTSGQPSPSLVARPDDLKRLADALHLEPIVAVDTESNSLYAYREKVCLIQFSTTSADYLVDPLALNDLSPLASLFSAPEIEKVFHAAEYDVLCLHRDFGFEVANLFDTMVAARILGRKSVGLGAMLKAEFGVHMDKRYQRANWGQRPLPPHLLDYARLDTHYLIPLRERLIAKLSRRDLLPLAREDFDRTGRLNANGNGRSPGGSRPADPWRISGSHDLDPQQAAVLLELCRYRDQVARSRNRPLFKVINDKTLLSLAVRMPASLEVLAVIPGMSDRQIERHGIKLLRAVREGSKAAPLYPPRSPRPSQDYIDRLEALRYWRKVSAQKMGVPSDVVLPRDLLFSLAEQNPINAGELAQVLGEVPWRLEQFGDQILRVLSAGGSA